MSAFSELVNIQFQDATSYPASVSGDIVALPFWHFWGPVEDLNAKNRTDFLQTYQVSFPPVKNVTQRGYLKKVYKYLKNFVQIKRAFEAGATSVVGLRLIPVANQSLYDKQLILKVTSSESDLYTTYSLEFDSVVASGDMSDAALKLKYFGVPTCADLGLDESKYWELQVRYTYVNAIATLILEAYPCTSDGAHQQGATAQIIEQFSGSLDPETRGDATNPFLGDLIATQSQFFKELNVDVENLRSVTSATVVFPELVDFSYSSGNSPMDIEGTYTDNFIAKLKDPQISNFSIFIVPSYVQAVKSNFLDLASERKDCVVLWGYNTDASVSYTKSAITTYKDTLLASVLAPKFFNLFLQGREKYVCFNYEYILDGTALWAGRIINVATDTHLNQMPSAQRYGLVGAVVAQTLTFTEVLEMHDNGINSLFMSAQGPMIFGIKSLFERQTSYWAKANVSRVIAAIIKAVIPEVMNVIHTEVVSDPIERSKFQVVLNRILDVRIAAGDIKPESYADAGDAINTDKVTNGGEILNVILSIFFKKLAERVNIKIIATDSSVDINIS